MTHEVLLNILNVTTKSQRSDRRLSILFGVKVLTVKKKTLVLLIHYSARLSLVNNGARDEAFSEPGRQWLLRSITTSLKIELMILMLVVGVMSSCCRLR